MYRFLNFIAQQIIKQQSYQLGQMLDNSIVNEENRYIPKRDSQPDFNGLEQFMKQEEDKFLSEKEILQDLDAKQQSEEDDDDDIRVRFSELNPAEEKIVKHGALQFDIKLGWVPKAQITGPIPIAFAHPDVDDLLMENIPKQSIVYFGYRPSNSFDVHKKYYKEGQNYPFNQFHLCKSQFLERFFRKYYSQFEFDGGRKEGMRIENSPLQFDSSFEGGNLDAVYLHENQYRLLTRVDTNTKGHCNYYYFKVKCNMPAKYAFRIVNMNKKKSLYQRGLRPYIRTKDNPVWTQGGQNVRYGSSILGEEYELTRRMYSLKFDYTFTTAEQTVEFCYGIPFTYTDLLCSLNNYRLSPNFHLNKLCYTLSGVEIPLVTITDSAQDKLEQDKKSKKYVIVVSARCHPGETHGSHIVNGFMKALLSNRSEATLLRKNIIFKIIPMINPDGVIVGNTRTSISGKDLNRVYGDKTDFVFPEIIGVRDFTKKLKDKYKDRFLFFIDVHGHSTRKNSFFFGPEYPVFDAEYPKCRLLPKIYANITEIFRYYSCKFRLSSFKQKTCRGYFNSNNVVRTYTFQTSMHCYFNFEQRKDEAFNTASLEKLGQSMMLAIHGYISSVVKLDTVKVPEPVDLKKKEIKQKKELKEQPEENSDEMESDKADSEESVDDYENSHMQIFYNRINQNREYFYEELMAFNNMPYAKTDKKRIKPNQLEEKKVEGTPVAQKEITIPTENTKKHNKSKSQWVPMIDFSPRKKSFVEYQKLSNMVFGSSSVSNNLMDTKTNLLYTSSKAPKKIFTKSKYTFFNPIFKGNNMNQSAANRFPDYRLEPKSKFFNKKQSISIKSIPTKDNENPLILNIPRRFSQSLDDESKQIEKKKVYFDKKSLQKLILQPKNLEILTVSESKKVLKQQPRQHKYSKQVMRSTSLKILPRKKSIKNFKQEEKPKKSVAKNMSEKGLATKLPNIERVISNY